MSIFSNVKDAFFGQAIKLAGNPRVTKLVSDPRVMNAAMKAMSLGGQIKGELDRAGRMAASVFGLATQDEVANLRSTISSLEDTIAGLEAKAAATTAEAGERSKPQPQNS
jgi:hypothetical protein